MNIFWKHIKRMGLYKIMRCFQNGFSLETKKNKHVKLKEALV